METEGDSISWLVGESKALNSKIFSLPRMLLLHSLENLGSDGATYRELKAGLRMEDGVLFSKLTALKKMGYVREEKVRLENQEMTAFFITSEGREALKDVKEWLGKWLKEG